MDAESRHLVLLCKNETGYRNLCYLVSMAFVEGFYIKPRIDLELLRAAQRGAHRPVGLPGRGDPPAGCCDGDYDGAKAYALEMRELFGEDSYLSGAPGPRHARPAGR